jgi:hypothetical protein
VHSHRDRNVETKEKCVLRDKFSRNNWQRELKMVEIEYTREKGPCIKKKSMNKGKIKFGMTECEVRCQTCQSLFLFCSGARFKMKSYDSKVVFSYSNKEIKKKRMKYTGKCRDIRGYSVLQVCHSSSQLVSFSIAHQDKRHKKAQIMNIYTTRNTTQ